MEREKGSQDEKQGISLRQIPGTIRKKNMYWKVSQNSLWTEAFMYSLKSNNQEKTAGPDRLTSNDDLIPYTQKCILKDTNKASNIFTVSAHTWPVCNPFRLPKFLK